MKVVEPKLHDGLGGLAGVGQQVIWVLAPGELGHPMKLVEFKEKCVQIVGELQDGDVEGSNDRDAKGGWVPLTDDEDQVRLTGAGLYHLKINPLWIRPVNRKSEGPVTFNVVATH